MKILYGARMCRFDFFRAVAGLACYLTKWSVECDKKLYRLMCYINSSKHLRMIGWVGDKPTDLQCHLFADADFAGCTQTQRSTSGIHLCVRGPRSCFPIAGHSKRQTCVSHSTPEAEIVAADAAVRTCGIPALILWTVILPLIVTIYFHEDNQAMIQVMKTGRNPNMRYMGRTHRTDIANLHEIFRSGDFTLAYETSTKMAADIYTKAFSDMHKWCAVRELISVFDPKLLKDLKYMQDVLDSAPSQSGGVLPPSLVIHPEGFASKPGWHGDDTKHIWYKVVNQPTLHFYPDWYLDVKIWKYRSTWTLRSNIWKEEEHLTLMSGLLDRQEVLRPTCDRAVFVFSGDKDAKVPISGESTTCGIC
jgi:hypothetical protein